jgi:hypothetical protein
VINTSQCDEERDFGVGTLMKVLFDVRNYYGEKIFLAVKRWKINSHEYMYRLLSQDGKVYESYFDPENWSVIR